MRAGRETPSRQTLRGCQREELYRPGLCRRRLPVGRGGDHVLLHFAKKGAAHEGQDGECLVGERRWKGGGGAEGTSTAPAGAVDGRTSNLCAFSNSRCETGRIRLIRSDENVSPRYAATGTSGATVPVNCRCD